MRIGETIQTQNLGAQALTEPGCYLAWGGGSAPTLIQVTENGEYQQFPVSANGGLGSDGFQVTRFADDPNALRSWQQQAQGHQTATTNGNQQAQGASAGAMGYRG